MDVMLFYPLMRSLTYGMFNTFLQEVESSKNAYEYNVCVNRSVYHIVPNDCYVCLQEHRDTVGNLIYKHIGEVSQQFIEEEGLTLMCGA